MTTAIVLWGASSVARAVPTDNGDRRVRVRAKGPRYGTAIMLPR
jgi:hypothetical protein